MNTRIWLALFLLAVLAAPTRAASVKLCVDESCSKKVKRGKLDCTVHKNKKKSLVVGFKFSVAFAAKVGPEVGFHRSTEINWNRMSQELIRRYEELCDMHNKAHLSVAEFNRRYDKLETYFDKAKDLKEEIEETVAGKAAKAFDALEAETRKHEGREADPDAVKQRISKIDTDVDTLSKDVSETAEAPRKSDG